MSPVGEGAHLFAVLIVLPEISQELRAQFLFQFGGDVATKFELEQKQMTLPRACDISIHLLERVLRHEESHSHWIENPSGRRTL